jgi:hypothetical protein
MGRKNRLADPQSPRFATPWAAAPITRVSTRVFAGAISQAGRHRADANF